MENKLKITIIVALFAVLATGTGCIVYGVGDTYGYVTTVEQGGIIEGQIFGWYHVWVRADLASSQTDCYIINDPTLIAELKAVALTGERVMLTFNRHVITWGCSEDQITNYAPAQKVTG